MPSINFRDAAASGCRWNISLLAAIGGMSLLGMALGCNQQPAASPVQAAVSQIAELKVVRPQRNDVRRQIERPGYNIEPYERTALYARIAGYVQKWNVDIGDRVRKDDVLAELYVPEMDVELRQKEASIRQAAAEIEQAKTIVLRAQAELDRAKSQYERMARVGRSGVLDNEQIDESRLGFQAAQATSAKAQADVIVAEARLDVAKAERDRVQTLLQYTKIRAPFDGAVTKRTINTGDLVQLSTASKDSLFVVEKVDPVRVFINIQELEAVWVRDGDAAIIRPQSLQGQVFKGKVARTSRVLNPQNRTLRTEIDLPNAENKLLPGMYVNVTIIAEHKNVWTLPTSAVLLQGEQSYCYRVENGQALRVNVQTGMRSDKLVEVLKKETDGGKSTWSDFTGAEVIIENAASVKEAGPVQTQAAKK